METVTIKSFNDYQQAAMRTLTESSNNVDYMMYGLLGEVGEVCGKVAKMIRDDDNRLTHHRAQEIVAELGDVAWMLAGRDYVDGIEWPDQPVDDTRDPQLAPLAIAAHAFILFKECDVITQEHDRDFHRSVMFDNLRVMARACGSSLREVLQLNIDKLTSRYNRGKIEGSGDFR